MYEEDIREVSNNNRSSSIPRANSSNSFHLPGQTQNNNTPSPTSSSNSTPTTSSRPLPLSLKGSSSSLTTNDGNTSAIPTQSKGWLTLRKHVLTNQTKVARSKTRDWPELNPSTRQLYYPTYSKESTSSGTGKPRGRFARLISSSGNKKEEVVFEQSIKERFYKELVHVEKMFDNINAEQHLQQALRMLDLILEKYRGLNSLIYQDFVLNLLALPFRQDSLLEDQVSAVMALQIYEKMIRIYSAVDMNEELSRWKWLLKRMEVESPNLRNQIANLIESTITPSLNGLPISSILIQSLVISSVELLHVLSSNLSASPIIDGQTSHYISIIRQLLHRIAKGEFFIVDSSQVAHTFSLSSQFLSPLSNQQSSQIVLFHGILSLASQGESSIREWLIVNSAELISAYWPKNLYGRMEELLLALWSTIAHFLLSAQPISHTSTRLTIIKNSLHNIISSNYSATILTTMSTDARCELVYAYLAYFISQLYNDYVPKDNQSFSEQSIILLDAKETISQIWTLDKLAVIGALKRALKQLDLESLVGIVGTCFFSIDTKVNKGIVTSCLPTLFERLRVSPDASESSALLDLLYLISSKYPVQFFKPLFSLSSFTSNSSAMITCLKTVQTLSKLLGVTEYLLKDAEMMVVVLLADIGSASSTFEADSIERGFGKARIGQLSLLLEMIISIKFIRENEEISKAIRNEAQRFADAFESKFSIFLIQREQSLLLSFSERILITNLLFELRMLGKPLTKPLWIDRMISWAESTSIGTLTTLAPKKGSILETSSPIEITSISFLELAQAKETLKLVYASVESDQKIQVEYIDTLPSSPVSSALLLFVAIHSFLSLEDLTRLCPLAWNLLESEESSCRFSAAYIITLCADRVPDAVDKILSLEINYSSPTMRQKVVNRLLSLFSLRFDLAQQPSADRSQKLPFTIGLEELSFIPLQVGSANFVAQAIQAETKFESETSLAPEIRRALFELGWNETTIRTDMKPLSLLPWSDLLIDNVLDSFSPLHRSPSPDSMLRRKSSGGNSITGRKRKAVITASIANLLLRLLELNRDDDIGVATCSKEAIITFLRDDPGSILRPLLLGLTKSNENRITVVRKLQQIVQLQSSLPPSASYIIFNSLAGLLKFMARDTNQSHQLETYSQILSLSIQFAPFVSNFSSRELRKNKVENLFISNFNFYYDSTFPNTSIFPRNQQENLKRSNASGVDSISLHLSMIRIAQNDLISNLAFSPSEAYLILKKLQGQTLFPIPNLVQNLEPSIFLPGDDANSTPTKLSRLDQDSKNLSALVARSFLLATLQILKSLSRNFNSREELATLFDGITRILLIFGNDSNILGLALRSFMLASSRFRRLFSSDNGFALFIPALFKVFVDAKTNSIRNLILYSFERFYISHETSFVFQLIAALAPLFLFKGLSEGKEVIMANSLFKLLEALQLRAIDSPDIDGIRGANEKEEYEALLELAKTRSEAFVFDQSNSKSREISANVKPFDDASVIKLFFTVIAFDYTSKRAAEYATIFRLLIPQLYKTSEVSASLIQQGIESLADLFNKTNTKSKNLVRRPESARPKLEEKESDIFSGTSMKRSYILLVEAYISSGGKIELSAIRKILEVVQLSDAETCTSFVNKYSSNIIGTTSSSTSSQIVYFLDIITPLVLHFIHDLNFTSLFNDLSSLHSNITFRRDNLILSKIDFLIKNIVKSCSNSINLEWYQIPSLPAAVRFISIWLQSDLDLSILGSISQHKSSPPFLSSFIFPLVISFGSNGNSQYEDSITTQRTQEIFLRFIGISLNSLQSNESNREAAVSTILSFQIIKIIILLGEKYLGKGIWLKLAQTLKKYLEIGSSKFLLENKLSSGAFSSTRQIQITLFDYLTWSFFEFISLSPNPIFIHLKPVLDEKLDQISDSNPFSTIQDINESSSSFSASSPSRNLNQQSFRKKRTMLEIYNESLNSTIKTNPNQSNPFDDINSSPVFNYVAVSHYENSASQLPSNLIKSEELIRKTLKRIRMLQVEEVNDSKVWTKAIAFRKILEEMKELEVEFKDILRSRDDEDLQSM